LSDLPACPDHDGTTVARLGVASCQLERAEIKPHDDADTDASEQQQQQQQRRQRRRRRWRRQSGMR